LFSFLTILYTEIENEKSSGGWIMKEIRETKIENLNYSRVGMKEGLKGKEKEAALQTLDSVLISGKGSMVDQEGTQAKDLERMRLEIAAGKTEGNDKSEKTQKTYDDLPSDKQESYMKILKQMDKDARLFVEYEGKLKRAEPAEIRECLDSGAGIYLVSRVSDESESSYSASSSQGEKIRPRILGIIGVESSSYSSSGSGSSSREYVKATVSKMNKWSSLDFLNEDKKGVPGAALLPKSIVEGGSVLISSSFESSWQEKYHSISGVIWTNEFSRDSYMHSSGSYKGI